MPGARCHGAASRRRSGASRGDIDDSFTWGGCRLLVMVGVSDPCEGEATGDDGCETSSFDEAGELAQSPRRRDGQDRSGSPPAREGRAENDTWAIGHGGGDAPAFSHDPSHLEETFAADKIECGIDGGESVPLERVVVDGLLRPRLRQRSLLRGLHRAMTCAPRCRAIWIAAVPTPPLAPRMRTRAPGLRRSP